MYNIYIYYCLLFSHIHIYIYTYIYIYTHIYIFIYTTPNISQCLLTIEDHRDGAQQSGPTCGAPILRRFSSPGELQILRFSMGNPYKSTRIDGTRNTIFWKNHLQFQIFLEIHL